MKQLIENPICHEVAGNIKSAKTDFEVNNFLNEANSPPRFRIIDD